MAVIVDGHQMKDVRDWAPADVREFLQSVLPGHPCVDLFTYTSGYVLDSLEKDELRRQARDEEAANVIWAHLKTRRNRAAGGLGGASATLLPASQRRAVVASQASPRSLAQDRALQLPSEVVTIYVRTRQETALELEVRTSDSVAAVKDLIAEREGTPRDGQRLVFNGICLQDGRTLASYAVPHGASVLLVPQLREQGRAMPRTFAPRGMLMIPGSTSWHPKAAAPDPNKPYLPVLCSHISRAFPISLEFTSSADAETFATTASQQDCQAVLEVQPVRRTQVPVEVRVRLDPDTGCVHLEESGDFLAPSTQYEAYLHFAGRGGHIKVTLATGASVA